MAPYGAMVSHPQDRVAAARPLIEKMGGKVHGCRSASSTSSSGIRDRRLASSGSGHSNVTERLPTSPRKPTTGLWFRLAGRLSDSPLTSFGNRPDALMRETLAA